MSNSFIILGFNDGSRLTESEPHTISVEISWILALLQREVVTVAKSCFKSTEEGIHSHTRLVDEAFNGEVVAIIYRGGLRVPRSR